MTIRDKITAWFLCLLGTAVYLLTLEPTVSFWDCGEFIATSYGLQVGHPPGAPTYNLLAHCLMLFSAGNIEMLAWWSNAVSAVAGGITVGLLYATVVLMNNGGKRPVSNDRWSSLTAAVGALCYLFCDTAWFSATESEVYSLATFFGAAMLWASLRWVNEHRGPRRQRWLLLIALLGGLSVGVHQLSLLVLPSVAVIVAGRRRTTGGSLWTDVKKKTVFLLLVLAFFSIGLSSYCIVPIRAAAKPAICYGDPSSAEGFKSYLKRDQYEKGPLWPRSWRSHPGDDEHYAAWSGSGGDLQLLATYQMGYMYLRYLMWNFSGRFNDRQGFGGLQNGQFITGIAPVDALIVGTGATPPDSIGGRSHNRYFALPLLLGIAGAVVQYRRQRRSFVATLVLFLMGGLVLGIYMNHPVYEPRERDYAYILSFYAFAIWISFGAGWLFAIVRKGLSALARVFKHHRIANPGRQTWASAIAALTVLSPPLLMACQNWDDHDRHHRFTAYDTAVNMLRSCDDNALLITHGDNDTFPLWYAQQVAGIRKDVTIANVNINGGRQWLYRELVDNDWRRPVYFTNYMHDCHCSEFAGHMQLAGLCYRLTPYICDSVDVASFYTRCADSLVAEKYAIKWHNPGRVHIDQTGLQFIEYHWRNVVVVANRLAANGDRQRAARLLDATDAQLPTTILRDKYLVRDIAHSYHNAERDDQCNKIAETLRETIAAEQRYFRGIRKSLQPYVVSNYQLADDFWND